MRTTEKHKIRLPINCWLIKLKLKELKIMKILINYIVVTLKTEIERSRKLR